MLFLTLFSGCTEENKSAGENSNLPNNLPPVGSISAPEKAYFGETIELDASKSYDSDGVIVSYNWDFGDNETGEGVTVKHIYKFENNFAIDYPLIYSVFLFVEDDDGSVTATSYQVRVYPRQYLFYLDSQKLITEKPSSGMDMIKGSGLFKLRTPQTLTYNLENSITIQKCKWNVTLYLEKSLLAIVNKLSMIFYDDQRNEIVKCDEKLGLSFWREKTVEIVGSFDKEEEFKSIKIVVYGFSLGEKISILNGDNKASCLFFDFTL
jgi:hypothetical protein